MNAAGRYARLRVGAHEVAVAAEVVQEAIQAQASPRPLPRRSGALADACASRHGTVPLLDLAHWLDLGEACTPGQQALVLRSGRRSVAVRISSMHGVGRAAAVSRLHHDEDPQELFQCSVRWEDGHSAALLEVERLMDLARIWCDDAGLAWQPLDGADRHGGAAAAPRQPHALLGAGGLRWAMPSAQLREVVPALPLEFTLPPGAHARGICTWRGRKLPVLDLAALHGGADRVTGGALMAIVLCGELGAAVLVDAALQVAPLAVPAQAAQFQPLAAPDGAEVLRVDMDALLRGLAEAEISRQPVAVAASGTNGGDGLGAARQRQRQADATSYLLFEADTTYATPVHSLVHVLALDEAAAEPLQRGDSGRLAFRGQFMPLLALPAYGGKPRPAPPRVALVVAMHDGALAAVAAHRVAGWVRADAVQHGALRAAAFGELRTITVTQGDQRSTHMVVDLDQVAYMLA